MTGPKSKALLARRMQVVPRGVSSAAGDVTVASASGATLIDMDGRELIDFAAGIGVANTGYSDPDITRAITEQAGRVAHSCIHVATHEPYVALCEKLTELLPHGERTMAMLINTGAEAVENAVKIARQATRRQAILCFEGGYHGRTLLGMTLTSKTTYKTNCGPFAPEVYPVPFPDFFKTGDGLCEADFVERELARFRGRFTTGPIPAQHVAAVIIEVVQGEGGFIPVPLAYLRGLREICDEHGILLICDEVQSGFARTGRWAAFQHADIVPDLSTYAKALGGGLPIGAVVGKAEIMGRAEPGTIGGTFGGNPVSCAAALATIKVMEDRDLLSRAEVIGTRVRQRFGQLYDKCPVVADVRGLGAMMAIELCYDRDPTRPATEVVERAANYCLEEGVLVLKAGPYRNVIRILSPLVIEDADLERGLDVIETAILRASNEGIRP